MIQLRNKIAELKAQHGRQTIDVTVFHGSELLFTNFEFYQNPRVPRTPGIWFAADEGYCKSHGNFIYECRVRSNRARWADDWEILTIDEAMNQGVDCQIAIHGDDVDDAIITCNDLSKIEIVRVFDPELETYLEFSEIEGRIAALATMAKHSTGPSMGM
jgi:hypothetical protein